eukprot:gene48420-58043_t
MGEGGDPPLRVVLPLRFVRVRPATSAAGTKTRWLDFGHLAPYAERERPQAWARAA